MRLRTVVIQHAVDALVVPDFAYSQVEIWVAPVPGSKPALMTRDACLAAAARAAALPGALRPVRLRGRRRAAAHRSDSRFALERRVHLLPGGDLVRWIGCHRRQSVALLLIGIAVPAWIIAQDRELRPVEIIPYALLLFAVWLLARRRRLIIG